MSVDGLKYHNTQDCNNDPSLKSVKVVIGEKG